MQQTQQRAQLRDSENYPHHTKSRLVFIFFSTHILVRMRITEKVLDEFIAIYREEFREEISRSEASEMASRLLTLYETLAKRATDHATTRHENRRLA
jgi:hypothetical protein